MIQLRAKGGNAKFQSISDNKHSIVLYIDVILINWIRCCRMETLNNTPCQKKFSMEPSNVKKDKLRRTVPCQEINSLELSNVKKKLHGTAPWQDNPHVKKEKKHSVEPPHVKKNSIEPSHAKRQTPWNRPMSKKKNSVELSHVKRQTSWNRPMAKENLRRN